MCPSVPISKHPPHLGTRSESPRSTARTVSYPPHQHQKFFKGRNVCSDLQSYMLKWERGKRRPIGGPVHETLTHHVSSNCPSLGLHFSSMKRIKVRATVFTW